MVFNLILEVNQFCTPTPLTTHPSSSYSLEITLFRPGYHFALLESRSKQLASLCCTSRLQCSYMCKTGLTFFLSMLQLPPSPSIILVEIKGCHRCILGGDRICQLLHHRPYLRQFLVDLRRHCARRKTHIFGEDGLAIHTGLKLNDVLGLRVGFILQRFSVLHRRSVDSVCCFGGCPSLMGIKCVGAESFSEHCAALEFLMLVLTL